MCPVSSARAKASISTTLPRAALISSAPGRIARIASAEVVLPCGELVATVAFFEGLGFRVEGVFPADDPVETVVSGHGLRWNIAERVQVFTLEGRCYGAFRERA